MSYGFSYHFSPISKLFTITKKYGELTVTQADKKTNHNFSKGLLLFIIFCGSFFYTNSSAAECYKSYFTDYNGNDHPFTAGSHQSIVDQYFALNTALNCCGSTYIPVSFTVASTIQLSATYRTILANGSEYPLRTKPIYYSACTEPSYTLNPSTPPPRQCPDQEGNPCSPATGNKFQTEQDYAGGGSSSALTFSRHYNSLGGSQDLPDLATGWRHNYSATMQVHFRTDGGLAGSSETSSAYGSADAACLQGFAEIKSKVWNGSLADASAEYVGGNLCRIHRNGETVTWFTIAASHSSMTSFDILSVYKAINTAKGSSYVFEDMAGQWIDPLNPDVSLQASGANWIFTDSNNTKETYNADGQLISITTMNGRTTTLDYDLAAGAGGDDDPQTLDRVQDATGHYLSLSYAVNAFGKPQLTSITTPDGDINYAYYANSAGGNLKSVTYPDNTSKTYHYEDTRYLYHLTGITDENGDRFATWTYNADGKAETSEHAGGVDKVTFTYNADGSTQVDGARGDSRTYHFEVQRGARVVSQVTGDQCTSCGNGHLQSRSYDANGFLKGYTDWNGNQTSLINNSRGLVTSRTEALGKPEERTTTTVWHPGYNLPELITQPGQSIDYVYYSNGQLKSLTVKDTATGNTRTTTYTYHPEGTNGAGLIQSIDGPRTDVIDKTTYRYDVNDNLTSIINALSQETRITEHDPSGRPLAIIDPNNVTTRLSYDLRGRLETFTLADGTAFAATTVLAYDNVGNLNKVIQPNGNFLSYRYDAAHRLDRVTDRLGHYIQYGYTYPANAIGIRHKTEVYDKNNNLRSTQEEIFNQLNRLTQTIGGEGQATIYDHDNNGNQDFVQDPLLRETHALYDALDRLEQSTDPNTHNTGYQYDARDNLTHVTDARDLTTVYLYDGLDNLASLDSPDTGLTTYGYDDAGNRTSRQDARGVLTHYHYDALNRLTLIEYPAQPGLNVTYVYDLGPYGIGRLRQMKDNSGVTTYTANPRGETVEASRRSRGVTYDTFYSHDEAGTIKSITYPSGKVISYALNANAQVKTVTLTDGASSTLLASNIGYHPFGPMWQFNYGNGLLRKQNLDNAYRVDNNQSLPVLNQQFTYFPTDTIDTLDNLLDASQSQAFNYDELDRLNSADGGYGQLGYGYDAVGNRKDRTDNNATDTYRYFNFANRLQQVTDSSAAVKDYKYNAVGSIRKIGSDVFAYGKTGRMDSATVNGIKTRYFYNGKGERTVKRAADGSEILYHYDLNGQLIAESQKNGTVIREYIYLNTQPLALLENGNVYYYHNDHLGTPQVMTDVAQQVVWQGQYDPFGAVTFSTEMVTNNLRFPGQYYDAESGLHYNYFRYYDPSTGRYITSDPIGLAGGINTYAYVGNNPLYWIDPYGLRSTTLGPLGPLTYSPVLHPGTSANDFFKDAAWRGLDDIRNDVLGHVLWQLDGIADIFDYIYYNEDVGEGDSCPTPDTHRGDFDKLRGDQGYRPKDKKKKNERWKKDKFHGDHWDISDKNGKKLKEVDFNGRQIWPGGPKNKNKR